MGNKQHNPWKEFLQNKRSLSESTRKSLFRSLLLLGLIILLTWVGKFKKITHSPPTHHDLLIWVFPDSNHFSALIVLPNDGDPNNDSADGGKIWFFPGNRTYNFLDSNKIRYVKNSLYFPTGLEANHIKAFCEFVPENHWIWVKDLGRENFCETALELNSLSYQLQDPALDRLVQHSSSMIEIRFAEQSIIIQWQNENSVNQPELTDSLLLALQLNQSRLNPSLPARIQVFPDSAIKLGQPAPELVPDSSGQALTVRITPKGRMYLKKIILPGRI